LADLLESSQHNGINDSRYDDQEPSLEIDVVISGGGLKHFFMVGAAYVLQKHLRKHNVRIARISGTSAGSWAALCMLTNFDAYHWMEAYHRNYANPKSPILGGYSF
jgi:predicted acylesterase/phospholipase RssA